MSPSYEQKHLVLIADDPVHLRSIEVMLRSDFPAARVTCTRDGTGVLGVLEQERVDLVITCLATLDAVHSLLDLVHCQRLIPLLIMAERGAPRAESLRSGGAIQYLETPIASDFFLCCVRDLLANRHPSTTASRPESFTGSRPESITGSRPESITGSRPESITGSRPESRIEVVSLVGFTRLLNMEQKTCALRVTASDRQGVLFFSDGDLVDAHHHDLRGMPAALEILAWNDVSITLDTHFFPGSRTIHTSLHEVLVHSHRLTAHENATNEAHTPAPVSALPSRPEQKTAFLLPPLVMLDSRDTDASPQPTPRPAPMPTLAPRRVPADEPTTLPRLVALAHSTPVTALLPSSRPERAPADPFSEIDDYFELMDRVRDLLRDAKHETAKQALRRALALRPSDRVALQNARVLAQRGYPLEDLDSTLRDGNQPLSASEAPKSASTNL